MGGRDVETLRIFRKLCEDYVSPNRGAIRDSVMATLSSTHSFPAVSDIFDFDKAWNIFFTATFQ